MTSLPIYRGLWIPIIAFAMPLICAATFAAENPTIKPTSLSAEKKKLAASLFKKIKDAREQLRSGVFDAAESTKRGKDKSDAEIFSAFDYSKERLRYDFISDLQRTARYFRTEKMSAIYSPATGYLIIMKPDGLASQSSLKPLDIRMIGFGTLAEHQAGWTFEKLLAFYTDKTQVTDIRKEADGIYHLILSHGSPTVFERHLWIDSVHGDTPVRYSLRFRHPKTKKWSEPRETVETKWAKRSGVWVPESVIAKSGGRKKTVWQLRIIWKSINKGSPDPLFERKSLKAKPGTVVVDNRSGKPVIVEKIASDK